MFRYIGAVVILLTVLLSAWFVAPLAHGQNVGINDDSDWWSIIRDNATGETLQPQSLDVAATNFQVLGVAIGQEELTAIQSKLGKTTLVTRGDAGTARLQICYTDDDSETHLNFETGEVQYAFYLFSDGPNWTGSNLCSKSKLITERLSTASGLRLGQSPAEVRTILGSPTTVLQNGDMIYFRQIRKRTRPSDLKRLRQYHADMSEQDFHENYDFYDFTAYIVARFSNSKLVYLGVSESETT